MDWNKRGRNRTVERRSGGRANRLATMGPFYLPAYLPAEETADSFKAPSRSFKI